MLKSLCLNALPRCAQVWDILSSKNLGCMVILDFKVANAWMLGMDCMKATVGLFVYDCKIAW